MKESNFGVIHEYEHQNNIECKFIGSNRPVLLVSDFKEE